MESKFQQRYLRKTLAKLARDDPKTKEVVLNGFAIGSEHEKMAQLAMSLVSNTHIKILSLMNCGINSKGAHLLAYALSKNRSLQHVWLSDNKIGSSGAKAIASALARNHSLASLGLAYNSIGSSGGRAIAKAMRQNRSIADVFVECNQMSMRVEDEINRICYEDEEEEVDEYHFNDCDTYTVAESIVSKSFVARTLGSIREVDYESDSVEDDDISTSSSESDVELTDMDFTSFYQKKKESKLSKLKAVIMRRKVKPGFQ